MSADKYPRIFSRQMEAIVYVYVASYVGRKSEVGKFRQRDLKMLGCFVINLLNNKTIILLNLAEYRLILADSAYNNNNNNKTLFKLEFKIAREMLISPRK